MESTLSLGVRVFPSLEELEARSSEWNALVTDSDIDTIYQTFEWQASWLSAFSHRVEPIILMVEEGNTLLQAGKRTEAHAAFKQATELDPRNDRAWSGCARTADDWSAMSEFAKRALEINPDNEEARGPFAATGNTAEPARAPARRLPSLRYLVPAVIVLVVLAFVIAKWIIH